jgi:C4-dicarboxylate-specific signal transduction histidine kinase
LKASTIATSRLALLGEMTAGIAHEINNSLSIISGLTNQMLRSVSNNSVQIDDLKIKLDKMKATASRIEKIIKGIKNQSRNGETDPFLSTVVRDLINDSVSVCADTLKTHEIKIIVDDIDPIIELDCRGTQISQVILNLISNSKDAIKHQTDSRWIRIGAKDNGKFIEFCLSDSGNGIAPEVREKMLQPFFTTKAVGEGTGLGLSITKNIIESHSGILTIAENTPNTTFIFSIPKGLSTQIN